MTCSLDHDLSISIRTNVLYKEMFYLQSSRIPMSLIAPISLTSALQPALDIAATCPSLDQWLAQHLSEEHRHMYATLIQLRADTQNEQFPVDFDTLWTSIGFSRKDPAKRLLDRVCVEDVDFAISHQSVGKSQPGRPPEQINLTLHAAQKFALKAATTQGNTIADFFVTVLKVVQEYHAHCLRFDLLQKTAEITEKALMSGVKKGKHLFYLGDLGIIDGVRYLKGGSTDDGRTRFATHKRVFPNGFTLCHITEHWDNRELERQFKKHPEVAAHRQSITYNGETYEEIWKVCKEMPLSKYEKLIPELVKQITDQVTRKHHHDERMKALENDGLRLQLLNKALDVGEDAEERERLIRLITPRNYEDTSLVHKPDIPEPPFQTVISPQSEHDIGENTTLDETRIRSCDDSKFTCWLQRSMEQTRDVRDRIHIHRIAELYQDHLRITDPLAIRSTKQIAKLLKNLNIFYDKQRHRYYPHVKHVTQARNR